METSQRHTALLAGFIGNVVEWYDFALYGYLAGILASLFFPRGDHTAALIATYGVFAAGFLMRPLGSAVFGWLGDTVGRSRTMLISVVMMALPTFLLGCLPTYDHVGLWAPVLLVVLRLAQGLSVGGEFSSSVTYLVETAADDRRGFAGSWANTGSMAGMLLGSGAAAATTTWMSSATVQDWGWRLPFWLGGVVGGIAILLRSHLPRSQHFQRYHDQRPATSPLWQAFTANRRQMILATLFASAYGVVFYLPLVYLPEWLHDQAGMARDVALRINTAATALLLVLIPVTGWLSDRVFRRTHFIAAAMLALAVMALPLHAWLLRDGVWRAVVVQFALVLALAVPLGAAPAMFAEMFPASDRLSGYSVAYNLGLGVVGGATPMLATGLIEFSGQATAPSWLLAGMAALACLVMWRVHDGSREPLPH